ncbi:erythromycin esterase family protein [Bradyrhizobium zhanjiangense]|uniref:Erythromycin esterase family protein n=1 Tax=Bradyrhizobium zhanjiangense TaxID=1325107 RepID=A0A4V1KVU8_9BRAD|nr:erythromycin esterase family protein [Bradyrhizobium zhanjiangense]RXG91943.1 erythromycin esterase family protein [Bradyrhizobium zhanjiangense]
MALSREAERVRHEFNRELIARLRDAGEHLPPPERDEFGAFFARFADSKIVLLGESTHGTSEFYRARATITRHLIERHGFNVVAVEADWPDAAAIDRHVRQLPAAPDAELPFQRFPTWMWRNVEVREFANYLHVHNQASAPDKRVEFRGLDVYSLGRSIAAVIDYLEKVDPERARAARQRYGCLTPWQSDPAAYGAAVLAGRDDCENAVAEQLRELLEKRLADGAGEGEAFFNATQNARIVRAAERYYRIMYRGSTESWNLRDRHMFDTLQYVMQRRGCGAKAVVWAHNSHVGNASATAMGWAGEFNIGELVRNAHGEDAALIGFGTDRGTVAAASDWGGAMEIKSVRPAREDSYEYLFRHTGVARSLTDLRPGTRRGLREALTGPRLERAIGVVYRPETELFSHYFEAALPDQFDAMVWFEETHAVTPLGAPVSGAAADTYPFGL